VSSTVHTVTSLVHSNQVSSTADTDVPSP
jgi:hypothetical protein